jgi:hypothetical protein
LLVQSIEGERVVIDWFILDKEPPFSWLFAFAHPTSLDADLFNALRQGQRREIER